MPNNDIEFNETLVRRLLSAQFPEWAALPLGRVDSGGTDNALFKLGEKMYVRLPLRESAALQLEKELRWLPKLAPLLPCSVPRPLGQGAPGGGYPWNWAVCDWIEGADACAAPMADLRQAAQGLGDFLKALKSIDPSGGPLPGEHNFWRGIPLAERDKAVQEAFEGLTAEVDVGAARAAWERALKAPVWNGPPAWIHGDLHGGNLLFKEGRLAGVIDFGGLALGDPACDLMVAWTLLDAEARIPFRAAILADDASWERGRGWALSFGLIALAYYKDSNIPSPGYPGMRSIKSCCKMGMPAH